MDINDALSFIADHPRALLATARRDGRPQLSPVLVALDAERRVVVSTRASAMKARNVERDPRVSVCVLQEGFFGRWVQVDGVATTIRLPEAMEPLVDYYRRLSGEHPDWDDYRRAMEHEGRVLLRIEVERAGPDVEG